MDEYDLAGMCEERRNCTFLFEGRQECDENKITCGSIGNCFQKDFVDKNSLICHKHQNLLATSMLVMGVGDEMC